MNKSIIYYTDNRLEEPIFSVVQQILAQYGMPIVSASLKPINFGDNYVVTGEPGYLTMVMQIITALKASRSEYVFFCEHDVLYPPSHFEFIPPRNDIFYYNDNVWRWDYPTTRAIGYDRLFSLSSLCVSRDFALDHYTKRFWTIVDKFWNEPQTHEPGWARKMGYEPGTKKRKRGGFSDDDFETWHTDCPIIDIRHKGTYSPPKVHLDRFKHPPTGWKEIDIRQITCWNVQRLFNLWN